jgi:hypothetical protein
MYLVFAGQDTIFIQRADGVIIKVRLKVKVKPLSNGGKLFMKMKL